MGIVTNSNNKLMRVKNLSWNYEDLKLLVTVSQIINVGIYLYT